MLGLDPLCPMSGCCPTQGPAHCLSQESEPKTKRSYSVWASLLNERLGIENNGTATFCPSCQLRSRQISEQEGWRVADPGRSRGGVGQGWEAEGSWSILLFSSGLQIPRRPGIRAACSSLFREACSQFFFSCQCLQPKVLPSK